MNYLKLVVLGLAAMPFALAAGCAKAEVEPTMRTASTLPKPDMLIINDFAVNPGDVKLDRGMMATAMRDDGNRVPNAEESQVGRLVAEKLASTLVEELREVGIVAVRAGPAIQPSASSIILNGTFLTVDQGNQSERVWIGFGMGGSELRTRIQALQAGHLIAQADTSTKSGLKPGMLTSAGASAAAGTGTAVAVGAVSTGVSEGFMATVEADARRTAKEVARKIRKGYQDRGWIN
jgi:Domain of unknown function (DUF4410)